MRPHPLLRAACAWKFIRAWLAERGAIRRRSFACGRSNVMSEPGARVLDVGSGSAILSDAARLVGAGCVIGCDIDPDAVRIARERVHLPMFVGSADAVRSRWADVIVANIDATTLELIAPELERVRKPESTLILSGFPEWDIPEGFSPREVLSLEEWRCFICVGHR